jgi:Protein required for attachment to host cells
MASSVNAVPMQRATDPNDASGDTDNVLVLVGDAQQARVVRRADADNVDVLWEGYAPTRDVRGLNQAPDINRNSDDATGLVDGNTNTHFAHEASRQLRLVADARPAQRLVVIAPRSFADALEAELGNAWPSHVGDVVYRDETKLDDQALRHLIDATVGARP